MTNAISQDFGKLISPGKLAQAHKDIEGLTNCTKCHTLGSGVTDENCLSCHKKIKERIAENKGLHASLQKNCITCHSDHKGLDFNLMGWEIKKFNHDKTGYILEEKHSRVDCIKCHLKPGTYLGTSAECISCHRDIHEGQLAKACEKCHQISSWKKFKFDHEIDSTYKLVDKHAKVTCVKCHPQGKYKMSMEKDCLTCHQDKHKGILGNNCKNCHNIKGWKNIFLDHNKTKYPLIEKHKKVGCSKCHKENKYKPIPTDSCVSADCHTDPHKKQFGQQRCESCHDTKDWKPSSFDHASPDYSGYKLTGKHIKTDCLKCHKEKKYKPILSDSCVNADCHTDPHKKQFGQQRCESCHDTKDWKPSSFDHAGPDYSGYKLTGKHIKTDCLKCHNQGKYKPIKIECLDCHKKDDTHKNNLGPACKKCHTTEKWTELIFKHNIDSIYPLTGKHVNAECKKCHPEKKYKPIKTDCISCHKDIHEGKFDAECTGCHTTTDWLPHKAGHTTVNFPLNGIHAQILCTDCHTQKKSSSNLSRECSACHTDPHLNQFGFSCLDCHNTTNWILLKFNHSQTGFRLSGRHRAVECRECHQNRIYRNIAKDCIGCHQKDYQSVKNIDHIKANLGQHCPDCHQDNFWVPAKFAHRNFSFKGAHLGLKNDCSSCHPQGKYPPESMALVPGTTDMDCYNCHKQNGMAKETYEGTNSPSHKDNGLSTSCTQCHTINSWTPAKYQHLLFNSSGAHRNTPCDNCHKNGYPGTIKGLSADDCQKCHLKSSGIATTVYEDKHTNCPANCGLCHNNITFKTGRSQIPCN